MGIAERVTSLVEPLIADRDLDLVDVEHAGPVVRVVVDRDGGVDLDTLSDVTRQLSRALDEHDPMPGRYTLEVSSPGLERPLRRPDHFRRVVGSRVSVRVSDEAEADVAADRQITGTLDAVHDDGIVVDGREVAFADIDRARTVFEWGPTPKPGGKKKKGRAQTQGIGQKKGSSAS